jgi:Fe-S-cluster containining protein
MTKRRLPVLERERDVTDAQCGSCGSCCGPYESQAGWPDLTRADVARLTDYEFKHYVTTEDTFFPALRTKMTAHHVLVCRFLKGEVGEKVSCAIYDRRPDACRKFPAGSVMCREFRRAKRIIALNA